MRIERGLLLAVGALTATAVGCAPGATGVAATASMPQVECSVAPLQPSPFANQAQNALNRTLLPNVTREAAEPLYRTALEQARQGIEADPENPYHFLLAGQAAAGLAQFTEAEQHFERALALCPELLDEEIAPVRQQAWSAEFERGLEAFRGGDTIQAIRHWEAAAGFWQGAANADFNLAVLYSQRGEMDNAARHYRRALEILETSPTYELPEMQQERLETRASVLNGMVAVGAQYFGQERYDQASQIFRDVTRVEPNSRDAWYNLALTYYRQERWQDLLPVAQRVVEMDPLNYNARIVLFNAYRGISDAAAAANQRDVERTNRDRALAVLTEAEALPVRVDEIVLAAVEDGVQFSGLVIGTGEAGGPITLEFTAYGASGVLGTGSTTVARPGQDATAEFSVTVPAGEPVSGWSYTFR